MKLSDAAFIVTGGGSGLGRATAEVFRDAGAKVALFDRDRERGEQAAESTGSRFYPVDVTDDEAVQSAVEGAAQDLGKLNGVVNCAGIGIAERVVGRKSPHPLNEFERVLRVNVVGTFNVNRWAAWVMQSMAAEDGEERGVMIQTASVAAFEGQIGQAAYSASKGAIVGMTLPIARELAHYGIRVVSIAPGIFDTPMLGMLSDERRKALGAQVPFPSRLGDPREYGQLARHIVENPMINGEVIRLDGALRMTAR